MSSPNVVQWFDDRFYKVLIANLEIKAIQKKVKKENPNYELLVLPSDQQGKSYIFLPSSTTIEGSAPKEWLGKWRGQIGNWEADRIMREKADRGSRIHFYFSEMQKGVWIVYNNSKAPQYSAEQLQQINIDSGNKMLVVPDQEETLQLYRLSRFFQIMKPQHISTEMTVVNVKEGYAGTLDMLWYLKAGVYDFGDKVSYEIPESGFYVLDIKTGAEDSQNYPEQIASYAKAVDESSPQETKGGIIIYTNAKNTKGVSGLKIDLYTKEQLEYHYTGFLNQYKVWIRKATTNPKIFDLPSLIKLN